MSIMTLWQPILGTAVLTFIAGSVIWMAMPWHKKDWSKTADEEAVGNALRGLAPGQYNIPHCDDPAEFSSRRWCRNAKTGRSRLSRYFRPGHPT